jgi:uncharacterized membrane protein
MSRYLSEKDVASLVDAIKSAEENSTGEIRVHIDSSTHENHAKAAYDIFNSLEMTKTRDRNAVLFYINFKAKYLTIIGDEGIHKKVQQSFWDHLHDFITREFSKGNYVKALKSAVLETGIELKKYFPVTGNHHNELPNEVTFS